ncbi:uncharacterized protein LOC121724080 [Alosa sapidissima]|uniref:uncharacterized protein LOC121724080 n=1 Tax=Alosa sapidissima TaxID=34773 RepID=UPI001C08CBCE|nr:uncharacterized protein LOC121724080 [Alosa sapidissima]
MAATMTSSSSTDDEENAPDCSNKSKCRHCYMHIASVKHEEVNHFTATRWNTYRTSLQKWLELEGECRDVAANFRHCLEVEFDSIPADAGFHHTCYRRFKPSQRWIDGLHEKDRNKKAAELKADQSILIHIKDKDCVALEVQYHKGCYSQYTRFLTRPAKAIKEQNEPMFDSSYRVFCERIIRQRLLINKEVLRMGQLRKAFIDLVKENEDIDASNYRLDMLKKRLTRDFPQLVFHHHAGVCPPSATSASWFL